MKKFIVLLLLLAVLAGCGPQQSLRVEGTPRDIVEKYYGAWSQKDYETMYGLVSDGWKRLEPTARSEGEFARFLDGFYNNAKGIRLAFASEQSNTGSEAVVSMALEVELNDGRFVTNNQTLTLRLKDKGWKLIHPYGDYVDDS